MTILNMPDEADDQAAWLDQQLVGSELATIVAELTSVHNTPRIQLQSLSAEQASVWLGDARESVLQGGLGRLSPAKRGDLLRNPELLLSLQELVLIEGGAYWDNLLATAASSASDLPAPLRAATELPADEGSQADPPAPLHREPSPPTSRSRRAVSLTVVAALAAALLVAVGTWTASQPQPWGWNRPEALAEAPADMYLEQLASSADEWGNLTPKSESTLHTRLEELIAGCDRLITSAHQPLDSEDRQWLVEKCRAWRAKLAEQLVNLDTTHDTSAVQLAVDEIVTKLSVALRTRADTVRARAV